MVSISDSVATRGSEVVGNTSVDISTEIAVVDCLGVFDRVLVIVRSGSLRIGELVIVVNLGGLDVV